MKATASRPLECPVCEGYIGDHGDSCAGVGGAAGGTVMISSSATPAVHICAHACIHTSHYLPLTSYHLLPTTYLPPLICTGERHRAGQRGRRARGRGLQSVERPAERSDWRRRDMQTHAYIIHTGLQSADSRGRACWWRWGGRARLALKGRGADY